MKKLLLLISLFYCVASFCQTEIKETNSKVKSHKTIVKSHKTKKKKKGIAIIHTAPGEEHIDSIKMEKMKLKK